MPSSNLRGLAIATSVIALGGVVLAGQANADQVVTAAAANGSAGATLSPAATDAAVAVASLKATTVAAAPRTQAASRSVRSVVPYKKGTVSYSKWYARTAAKTKYGWGDKQHRCLVKMWQKESEWKTNADDSDNGYTWGIPQARPGTKMRSAGHDWRTNPDTQIRWGLRYIDKVYGSPCQAWSFWQDHRWY